MARDWGLWRTARGNLEHLAGSPDALVAGRADALIERWDRVEHKGKARVRALVGERVRWYEEPEEV